MVKPGNTEINIAPLAFGGNVFGWTIDEPTSFKLQDSFIAHQFNLVDTADVYSRWKAGNAGGESETIIGNWMKSRGNREKVIVATKVGSDMGEGKSLRKEYILRAAEASLKRLQTDYIDLYQTHYDEGSVPVEEKLEAYSKLVNDGKVRYIGASNMTIERLKKSVEFSEKNKLPRYETLQPLYNLYDREMFEKQYQQYCLEKNISVLPYYSLASGFLSGKYRSENDLGKSARGGGIKKYLNSRGLRILAALDDVTERYNTKSAAVSLAWLMAQPTIAAPIASATNLDQLNELMSAINLKLDKTDIDALNKASEY